MSVFETIRILEVQQLSSCLIATIKNDKKLNYSLA